MATCVRPAHVTGADVRAPASHRRGAPPPSIRRFAAAIALTLGLFPAIGAAVLPAPAAAQSTCEFVLGFARLRDLVGADVVGSCLEDQRTVLGGNAVQRTANGLIVWRLVDNWIAFTDGFWTWVNGPNGVEQRLNTERFSWEAAPG